MDKERFSLIPLTSFPALARCSVVDSRIGPRGKIIQDLKASCLFEEIIEAKSLEHAKQLFLGDGLDLCILGPSVSPKAGQEVIEFSKETCPQDSPCAFVAVLSEEYGLSSTPHFNGVHGELTQPYSKASFSECLINAVIKANRQSPWAKLAKGYTVSEEDGIAEELRSKENQRLNHVIEGNFEIPVMIFPALKEIVKGHEEGEYGLLIDGTPTKAAIAALNTVAEELLKEVPLPGEVREVFQSVVEKALLLWFRDMVLTTPEQATVKFQQSIKSSVAGLHKRIAQDHR